MYSNSQLFLIFSGLFFAAVMFSLLINSLFMRFSRTLGSREHNADLARWSDTHKPAFGGIAFFIVFLGTFAIHGALFPDLSRSWKPELFGLLAATSMGFLMGLADDAYNTRPVLKFLVQVLCGVVMIVSGTSIRVFDVTWADHLLTIVWVVGIMNSINMLDNMDAVSSIVSIFIFSTALMAKLISEPFDSIQVLLLVGTIAALIGFLFFNWHPSRMYMGDTGSQFLGVYLAFIGIQCFWNGHRGADHAGGMERATITLLVFLLPIIDTTVVTINRIARGTSPFVGGRDHTTHHLSYAGLSDAQVALTFVGLSTVSMFLTFVIHFLIDEWRNIHSVIFVSYAVILFLVLFLLTKRKRSNDAVPKHS
ncbi:MAG: undecaprenyl/decaprenyl-phosphate alpha-N-acetylglucosaminyl 1-phosphate transferase [Flavobacteriales bacterium]|nr:undecaprenyl/decaprenyl-phosphate alpha-N-acetylglucosaminyl 1-phosphate transferase [Flavobacteriales bacterium]